MYYPLISNLRTIKDTNRYKTNIFAGCLEKGYYCICGISFFMFLIYLCKFLQKIFIMYKRFYVYKYVCFLYLYA